MACRHVPTLVLMDPGTIKRRLADLGPIFPRMDAEAVRGMVAAEAALLIYQTGAIKEKVDAMRSVIFPELSEADFDRLFQVRCYSPPLPTCASIQIKMPSPLGRRGRRCLNAT